MEYCEDCDNILISKDGKFYCRTCDKYYEKVDEDELKVGKKVNENPEKEETLIKQNVTEEITDKDRDSFEDYFKKP